MYDRKRYNYGSIEYQIWFRYDIDPYEFLAVDNDVQLSLETYLSIIDFLTSYDSQEASRLFLSRNVSRNYISKLLTQYAKVEPDKNKFYDILFNKFFTFSAQLAPHLKNFLKHDVSSFNYHFDIYLKKALTRGSFREIILEDHHRKSRLCFDLMIQFESWNKHVTPATKNLMYKILIKEKREATLAHFFKDCPEYLDEFRRSENIEEFCRHGLLLPLILLNKNNNDDFFCLKFRYGNKIPVLKLPVSFELSNYKNYNLDELCNNLFNSSSKSIKKIFLTKCLCEDRIDWFLIHTMKALFSNNINHDLIINFCINYNPHKRFHSVHCKLNYEQINVFIKELKLYYSEHRILKLVENIQHNHNLLTDTKNMLNQIINSKYKDDLPKKPKNIKDLHNKISILYTIKTESEFAKDLNQDEISFLDNLKLEEFTIKVPKTSVDLAITGKLLKHCVASYSSRIIQKRSFIFNLYNKEKIQYTIELSSDYRIIQARGYQNSAIPNYLRQKLNTLIKPYQFPKPVFVKEKSLFRKFLDLLKFGTC